MSMLIANHHRHAPYPIGYDVTPGTSGKEFKAQLSTKPVIVIQTTTTTNLVWISSDCSESFSPLSNDVTGWVITTWSNRMKFRLQETFVNAGFLCWLSQVPSVVGPTPCVHSRDHRVWGKKLFWTWHEKMLLFSNIRGEISLLDFYWDVAVKKSAVWWVSGE